MRWPTVTSFLSELPVVCPPLEVCAGPGGGKSVSVLVHGVNTWPSLSDNDWETPVAVPSHFFVISHCPGSLSVTTEGISSTVTVAHTARTAVQGGHLL